MKRAQAALEFLTTYGWAFLIMMTMIGAVSYYGVSNPATFVPEQCHFSELQCEDFLITSASVPVLGTSSVGVLLVDVTHTFGRTAYVKGFACEDVTGGQTLSYLQEGTDFTSTDNELPLGDNDLKPWDPKMRMSFKCFFSTDTFSGREGDVARIPVTVTLQRRENGFLHEMHGEVIGKIQ